MQVRTLDGSCTHGSVLLTSPDPASVVVWPMSDMGVAAGAPAPLLLEVASRLRGLLSLHKVGNDSAPRVEHSCE